MTKAELLAIFRQNGYDPEALEIVKGALHESDKIAVSPNKKGIYIGPYFFPFHPILRNHGLNASVQIGSNPYGGFGYNSTPYGGVPTSQLQSSQYNYQWGAPGHVMFLGIDLTFLWQITKDVWKFVRGLWPWLKRQYEAIRCWRSTWTPKKAIEEAEKWIRTVQERINQITEDAKAKDAYLVVKEVNDLLHDAAGWQYDTIELYHQGKWHHCSAQSIKKIILPTRDKILETVKDFANKLLTASQYFTPIVHTCTGKKGNYSFSYECYEIQPIPLAENNLETDQNKEKSINAKILFGLVVAALSLLSGK